MLGTLIAGVLPDPIDVSAGRSHLLDPLRCAEAQGRGGGVPVMWFVGASLAAVWFVFRDPNFDVRPLVLGALLPELDGLFGGARLVHTLLFSLTLLFVVMITTIGQRATRKRWLALPIGTMLHLVVDGAWTDAHVFGWPLGGWSFGDTPLPIVERGWWNVPLELAGLALLAWCWRAGKLGDPQRRRDVARTGRLFAPLA